MSRSAGGAATQGAAIAVAGSAQRACSGGSHLARCTVVARAQLSCLHGACVGACATATGGRHTSGVPHVWGNTVNPMPSAMHRATRGAAPSVLIGRRGESWVASGHAYEPGLRQPQRVRRSQPCHACSWLWQVREMPSPPRRAPASCRPPPRRPQPPQPRPARRCHCCSRLRLRLQPRLPPRPPAYRRQAWAPRCQASARGHSHGRARR